MAKNTKAFVFDFGNVIIDIDIEKTFQAFADLTFKSKEKVKQLFDEADLWKKYEVGFYTSDEFRDVVRQTLSYPLNDQEIDDAWNALLLEVSTEKIAYIEQLRYTYPVYLLSNTNPIHIEKCLQYFRTEHNIADFRKLFNHVFLSYEIGLWKPDYRIYQHVVDHTGHQPEELLFLDDNADNIAAARDMGIQTVHVQPPESFAHFLDAML